MRGKVFGALVLALILMVPFANVHAGLQDGLVAYYPFNGNANDASGNGNNGKLNGGLALTTDRYGMANSAYLFNGINSYINVPDAPSLHPVNQMTIAFWMRIDGFSSAWSPIIYKDDTGVDDGCFAKNEYAAWINQDRYMHITAAGNSNCQHGLYNSKPISIGQWHLIVGTIDRNVFHKMKIYIDGILEGESFDSYTSFNYTATDLFIGWPYYDSYGSYSAFKGSLDEIRLYNRALSESEIQQLYHESTNKPPVIKSFTADPTTGSSPLTVKFQCEAKDPDGSIAKYNWICGDGKTISTTTNNAGYTYRKPGTYKARVKVVDNDGGAATSKLVTITVSSTHSISGKVKTGTGSPIPGVTMSLTGAASRTTSTGSNGNYTLSELKNGVYTITPVKDQYTFDPANRSVSINGANASSQNFTGTLRGITVISPNGGESWPIGSSKTIKWAYSGNVGSNVRIDLLKGGLLAGTIVQSTSVGASGNGAYTWLIPSNVPSGADYRIGITSVANSSYKDTSDNTFTIEAAAPTANFSATPTSGDAPLTVQFTDQSTGEITSRVWDFGDWTTSTEQHPTHTYTNPGSYGVSLNVMGPGGSDSEVKSNFVTVSQPTTKYTLTVTKKGTGVGKVTSSPKGIDCGADCSEKYRLNTSVILTAVPDTSSVFSGWSGGGCSGTGECSVAMTENCNVTAKFDPRSSNKPDLAMTLFSAQVTAVAGQTIQVPNTVKNQGKVSAGPFTIGIYLSKDKVLSPTGDILLESRDRLDLDVGQSSAASTSVSIPENISIGTYYIGAMADIKNVVDESNEANNAKLAPKMIQIVSPLPDLIVTDVSGPVTAKMGQAIEIFDAVKNAGRSDARDEFSINIYLSKDAKIDMVDDIYLGSHGLAGLSVGQTVRKKIEVTIPSDIEPGAYYLGAWVDSEDAVLESSENNNIKSSIATIQVKK